MEPARAGHLPAVTRSAAGVTAGILVLAGASLALPSAPTTDPWGWIVWGRELIGGDLDTDVGGTPSWKPLPVAATALLALLGDAAPEGWLFVARALGLAGIVLAFLAGRRLGGPGAGIVAAVALVLASGWARGLAHGYTEPLVVAALLAALLTWLDGRRAAAFALLAAGSLARPELWPLLILAAGPLGRGSGRARATAWAAVAAVPLLWVGVDWLASGRAFNGSSLAATVARDLSPGQVLELALAMPVAPVLVLAAIGALRGDRLPALLGAATVAWALGLAAAVGLGYPPSERLMAPLMAAVCPLAGVGAMVLVRLPGRLGPLPRGGPLSARAAYAASIAIAVGLAAAAAPFAGERAGRIADQMRAAGERAELQHDLRRAARLANGEMGHAGAVALPADLVWSRGAVAWEQRRPLAQVGSLGDPPPAERVAVFLPASRRAGKGRPIVRTRAWRVLVARRAQRASGFRFARGG